MIPPSDDIVILQRIARGQTGALGELYDRYGRLVFSLVVRMLGSSELAEEVTQDAFTQAWRKAASYDPAQGKVSTWLVSIARHRAIDLLRQQHARPEGHQTDLESETLQRADPSPAVESAVELSLEQQRVRRALAQIPPDQRRALELAYFDGLSQQEIADALRQPLGTVKTRVRLGMQKLRELLSE